MKTVCLVISLFFAVVVFGQDIKLRISNAIDKLEKDEQFKHAIIGMYVLDSKTGKPVYEKNGQLGLAPASCQKVITSATAFELLGADYSYKTAIGYDGSIVHDSLTGFVHIVSNYDPTFGSWRWKTTSGDYIITKMMAELARAGIGSAKGFVFDNLEWGAQTLPDGWVWQDIGNYYGAGCDQFNWHENQYDIVLKPGKKIGDPVKLLSTPRTHTVITTDLKTAAEGTGDQAYVYCAPNSDMTVIRGTIPLGVDSFTLTASDHNPANAFQVRMGAVLPLSFFNQPVYVPDHSRHKMETLLFNFVSPSLDSINYWFLKKSVNLYGEAFVKTIAYEQTGSGSTDTGVAIIKEFWRKKGIDQSALNIIDGSGLSPANRVTANALVQVLQFARSRSWFRSFYNALPEMNGIKMKDGYIGGVRSYTGYVKSKSGMEYTFAFIVNNFDGSPGTVREKIWKLLDLLK